MQKTLLKIGYYHSKHGDIMEDYFIEMRLSREFACRFDEYLDHCRAQNVKLPEDLIKSFEALKEHYKREMEKNLS